MLGYVAYESWLNLTLSKASIYRHLGRGTNVMESGLDWFYLNVAGPSC